MYTRARDPIASIRLGIAASSEDKMATKGISSSSKKVTIAKTADDPRTPAAERALPFTPASLKELQKRANRMHRKKTGWDMLKVLDGVVENGQRVALAWHMTCLGILDTWSWHNLWSELAEDTGTVTGVDLAAFLVRVTNPQLGGIVPGWSDTLDRMVMPVYARDPQPLDAAWPSFPEPVREGFKTVLVRFGRLGREALSSELPHLLARQYRACELEHAMSHGDDPVRYLVWDVVGGQPAQIDLRERVAFRAFIEKLCDFDAFVDAFRNDTGDPEFDALFAMRRS